MFSTLPPSRFIFWWDGTCASLRVSCFQSQAWPGFVGVENSYGATVRFGFDQPIHPRDSAEVVLINNGIHGPIVQGLPCAEEGDDGEWRTFLSLAFCHLIVDHTPLFETGNRSYPQSRPPQGHSLNLFHIPYCMKRFACHIFDMFRLLWPPSISSDNDGSCFYFAY